MKRLTLTDKLLAMILLILLVNYYNDYKEKRYKRQIAQQELSNKILLDFIK